MERHFDRRALLIGALAAGLALPSACGPSAPEPPATAPKTVATFSILTDVLSRLSGPAANVTSLTTADLDAHNFDPTPSTIVAIEGASLIAGVGLGFEPWLDQVLRAANVITPPWLTAVGLDGLIIQNGRPDPHVWSAPETALTWVNTCATGLKARLPAMDDGFDARLEAYIDEIAPALATTQRLAEAFGNQGLKVVVPHASFGYLGRALGIEFIGLHGLAHDQARGGAAMAGLIDSLKGTGAAAVFLENTTDPSDVQELARQTGMKIGGRLYSDALSAADGPASSLPALLMHNLTMIAAALEA